LISNKIIIGLLFPLVFSAQGNDVGAGKNSHSERPLFLFSAAYRLPAYTGKIINSGRGAAFEIGINPAKYFTQHSIFGVYAGWAWKDNLWYSSFRNDFVQDYRSSINTEQISGSMDSALINRSASLFASKKGRSSIVPGCETNSFHNYSVYYGIILKLPSSFFPVVKLYKGSTRSHYLGPGDIITAGTDYTIVQLRRSMYGIEVMLLDPFQFGKGKRDHSSLNKIGVSAYYEYGDLTTSSLFFDNGKERRLVPLKKFTDHTMLQKYRHEHVFGFKLSYNLY
jgi:hypothetical protein